jgi:DnaJ-class molecular chaperone
MKKFKEIAEAYEVLNNEANEANHILHHCIAPAESLLCTCCPTAEQKFKEIAEAYEVLNDEEKTPLYGLQHIH